MKQKVKLSEGYWIAEVETMVLVLTSPVAAATTKRVVVKLNEVKSNSPQINFTINFIGKAGYMPLHDESYYLDGHAKRQIKFIKKVKVD